MVAVEIFQMVLRESVECAALGLRDAQRRRHPAEVHRHAARLMDLLDRARDHGVATAGWVSDTTLDSARTAVGARV
jgi:hypothetical protein